MPGSRPVKSPALGGKRSFRAARSRVPRTPENAPLLSLPSQCPPLTGSKSSVSFGIDPGATSSTHEYEPLRDDTSPPTSIDACRGSTSEYQSGEVISADGGTAAVTAFAMLIRP